MVTAFTISYAPLSFFSPSFLLYRIMMLRYRMKLILTQPFLFLLFTFYLFDAVGYS
jgi:hypothetical protein